MSAPELPRYKKDFIDFMVEAGVLCFGEFTTRSGRSTPYFVNTGLYRTGDQIRRLGQFYAEAITERLGNDVDVLFGPAYKGIPLVVATASALAEQGVDVAYCFNRKEVKDHGEGGLMVGHRLGDGDRVVIVEDITTAGSAVREVVPLLRSQAAIGLAGLVVSVDRAERGVDDRSALTGLAEDLSIPAFAIVTIHDILAAGVTTEQQRDRIERYLQRYGSGEKQSTE